MYDITKSTTAISTTTAETKPATKTDTHLDNHSNSNVPVDTEKKDKTITGFNIGINSGVSAGQTIFHCHIHLIPRRDGDVKDPRGGVRGVIPEKQKY